MLEAGGLKADVDFFLAFSPERVDPGNPQYTTRTIPEGRRRHRPGEHRARRGAVRTRGRRTVVPVSSTRVAEMVKLLENTFRAVNIGLVNEIALMCHKMDIDVWEVIDAAKTKPFGFMPFYPGPGLGGHCIPIDPFYLSWKARQSGFECRFIELAGQVNASMPEYVVRARRRRAELGEEAAQRLAHSSVRRRLQEGRRRRARIAGARHHRAADRARRGGELHRSVRADAAARRPHVRVDDRNRGAEADPIAWSSAPNHSAFDYDALVSASPLIVDSRNALKNRREASIFRLVKIGVRPSFYEKRKKRV